MATYVMRDGQLVDKSTGEPMPQRDGPFDWRPPAVVSDWEPVKSPIDGKTYDGKAAYLNHLKAHDCVIVGNDMPSSRYGGPGGHARYKGGESAVRLPVEQINY